MTLKYIPKTKFVPSALLVVVIATPITYALHLEKKGMLIIGDIPKGLPPGIRDLFPSSLITSTINTIWIVESSVRNSAKCHSLVNYFIS